MIHKIRNYFKHYQPASIPIPHSLFRQQQPQNQQLQSQKSWSISAPTSTSTPTSIPATLGHGHFSRIRKFDSNPQNSNNNHIIRRRTTHPNDVFVNNEVNLNHVDVYGFDYDWTLCCYAEEALQSLIYDLTKQYLLDQMNYPTVFSTYSSYDPQFAIRGLCFDIKKGLLLKISTLNNVVQNCVFFGRKRLSLDEILIHYGGTLHIPKSYQLQYLRNLYDLFCLPETCLISDIIQFFVDDGTPFDPSYVYQDVTTAVNAIHTNGSLHYNIMRDLPKYLEKTKNGELGQLLKMIKDNGKRLFLLTNSPFFFINTGLEYILSPKWRDLFDIIITSADKPSFFSSNKQFRSVDPSSSRCKWTPISELKHGEIYCQGSLKELTRLTNWKGHKVIYFGDHLNVDLSEHAKNHGWRTGMVISEIQREINVRNSKEYQELELELLPLEERLMKDPLLRIEPSFSFGSSNEVLCCNSATPTSVIAIDDSEEETLEARRKELLFKMSELFNHNFGSIFQGVEDSSLFASDLVILADIYTSRVENFLRYPANHRFYRKRNLPHEAIF